MTLLVGTQSFSHFAPFFVTENSKILQMPEEPFPPRNQSPDKPFCIAATIRKGMGDTLKRNKGAPGNSSSHHSPLSSNHDLGLNHRHLKPFSISCL